MQKIRVFNVYKITNLINQKIYIGRSSTTNPYYLGSGKLIKQAVLKHGRKNFKKEILKFCDSLEDSKVSERFLIASYDSFTPKGYNISVGGEGELWWEHHPDQEGQRERRRQTALALWSNPEKLKQREATRRKRYEEDEEYKRIVLKNIKAAHNIALSPESNEKRKKWWNAERCKEKSDNVKEWFRDNPQEREKRSRNLKKMWKSEEYRTKILENLKPTNKRREKWSRERVGGKNNKARAITCTKISTGEKIEIECVKYAASRLGILNYKIRRVLSGKQSEVEGWKICYKDGE